MGLIQKERLVFLILFSCTLLLYSPILINPEVLLERGNDLEHLFWPVFYFIKQQFWANYTLPLWNNLFFSGTPLLPDPQFPLFYPPYILFLILPINIAFLSLIIVHTLLGGIGSYLIAKNIVGLGKFASTFTGILFLFTPRLAGYLEAGHVGLIEATSWLPLVFFAAFKLIQTPKGIWSILLAISLGGVFYTHTIIFILTSLAIIALFGILLTMRKLNIWPRYVFFFLFTAFLTFGLTAITLLSQIEWMSQTTRFLLLQDRDVYPKWTSFKEFLQTIFAPWTYEGGLGQIDTEKWLTLGITPLLLALFGFFFLKRKLKISVVLVGFIVVLVSLNNISPLYPLFLSLDWYVLGRVATRIWFIPTLLVIFLAGFGLEKLISRKNLRGFIIPLVILVTGESLLLSWVRILKPAPSQNNFVPQEVYGYLNEDKDKFRVFCTTRCLSQRTAAEYGLELVEGYNTLQQKNYYNQFIQLSQVFWDHYTLALPPFEIYHFREIQPYAPELADYNVKYVISPHQLTDKKLLRVTQFENYLIYKNTINKNRAYFLGGEKAPILFYSPNEIIIDTSKHASGEIILAEVWNSGWKAYLNGNEPVLVEQTKSGLRIVQINPTTSFVVFKYEPEIYKTGKNITVATILIIILIIVNKGIPGVSFTSRK